MADKYRTKPAYGTVLKVPSGYAVISLKGFQNALSFCCKNGPHLQHLAIYKPLSYKNGAIYIGDDPVSQVDLEEYFTVYQPGNIDLVILRCLFSFILGADKSNWCEKEIVTIYLPDLCRFVGKTKPSREEVDSIIKGIEYYRFVIGVMDGKYLPVLTDWNYDQRTNSISFKSPYMCELIQIIEEARIRTLRTVDSAGKKRKRTTGTRAAYTYVISPEIRNERNKKAIEIVHIVSVLIEQKGSWGRDPAHISVQTIIDRVPELKAVLVRSDPSNRNKELKMAFKKAWELLHIYTDLEQIYNGIELPDPRKAESMPTWSDKGRVIKFKHAGKLPKWILDKENDEYER